VKIDRPRIFPSVPDKRWDVPADEYNRVLDSIVEAAEHIAALESGSGVFDAILLSAVTAGQVVHIKGTGTTGTVPRVEAALANTSVVTSEALYLALSGGIGGDTITMARQQIVAGLTVAGSPANDAAVFVTDTGTLSTVAGTNERRVGKVIRTSGGLTTVAFDGGFGAGAGGGGVSSVGATAPIASTGGATPVISISAATTGAAGSMSAADKTKLDAVTTANIPSAGEKSALAGTSGTPGSGNKYVTEAGLTLQKAYDGGATIATANAKGTPTIDATSGSGSLASSLLLKVNNIVALMLWNTAAGLIALIKGAPSSTTGTQAGSISIEGGDGDGSHNAGTVYLDAGVDGGGGAGEIRLGTVRDSDLRFGRSNANVAFSCKAPLLIGDGGGSAYAAIVAFDKVTSGAPGPLGDGVSIYGKEDSYGVVRLVEQPETGAEARILTTSEKIVTKTSNYTLSVDDDVVHVDSSAGAVALTVPSPLLKRWKIKKVGTGTNAITIVRAGSEKIENTAATYTLPGSVLAPSLTQPLAWELYGDATDWWIN
jgi:hypothetical protein